MGQNLDETRNSLKRQLSKKKLIKKKGRLGVTVHAEGKHLCNCLTRNYRKWLGKKRYGFVDETRG